MANALIADNTTLTAAISDWSWRASDAAFAANISQFIANFEASFKRTQRTLEMQENVTGTVANAQVPLPSDHIETIVFKLTGLGTGIADQVLRYVTPARAQELNTTTSPTGAPQWFTLLEGNFVIVPSSWVPVGATYSLDYYGFASITAAPNWLVQKHPDIYLYGSLMQGIAYIDDKDTVAFWTNAYDRAMGELTEADKKQKVVGPLQMRPSMSFRTSRQRLPFTGH